MRAIPRLTISAAAMRRCQSSAMKSTLQVIKGLKSKEDCDDWLSGSRKIDWLRSQGLAK